MYSTLSSSHESGQFVACNEGEQGAVKTKDRLRTEVWLPRWITMRREDLGSITDASWLLKTSHHFYPKKPCEEVAVDLLGLLPSGEHLLVIRELKHQTFLTTRTAEKPRKTGSRPSFLAPNRKVKQSTFLRHGLLPVLTCLRKKVLEI